MKAGLAVIFLPIYGGLGYLLWEYLPPVLAKNIEPILFGKMLSGLSLILFLLLLYLVHLKIKLSKEANIDNYEIYKTSNDLIFYILKNDPKKKDLWFCANCMDKHRLPSKIQPNYNTDNSFTWYCPGCEKHLRPFKYDGNDGRGI